MASGGGEGRRGLIGTEAKMTWMTLAPMTNIDPQKAAGALGLSVLGQKTCQATSCEGRMDFTDLHTVPPLSPTSQVYRGSEPSCCELSRYLCCAGQRGVPTGRTDTHLGLTRVQRACVSLLPPAAHPCMLFSGPPGSRSC